MRWSITDKNITPEAKMLLEEANRRFPIGMRFTSIVTFMGQDDIRKGELCYNDITKTISANYECYVYHTGTWATSVEMTEPAIHNGYSIF